MCELSRKFSCKCALAALSLFLIVSPSYPAVLSLKNELSPNHVEVPGTGAYFVPAEGLFLSKRFDGFESESRGIEVVVVNIRSGFDGIVSNFTEATLKSRGVELKSKGELTINGRRAVLLKALHPEGGRDWGKWILLSENGDNTLVANGIFVSGDGKAAEDVEAMFKSLFLEAGILAEDAPDSGGSAAVSDEIMTSSADIVSADVNAAISGDAAASGDISGALPDAVSADGEIPLPGSDNSDSDISAWDLISGDAPRVSGDTAASADYYMDLMLLSIYDRANTTVSADNNEMTAGSEDARSGIAPAGYDADADARSGDSGQGVLSPDYEGDVESK
jgi:hypothetical protein